MKPFLIALSLSLAWSAAPAADLLAVYQRALQNDPQLKEAEATRLAALESKPQALAALLPQLSGSGTASKEKDAGQSNQSETVQVAGGPTIVESFPFNGRVTTVTHKYGVDLKQSLFRWENWVALQRADAQVAQAEADYQAAQQDLIARVAQRYFDVLAAQDDLDAQRGNLESVSRQLEQAEKRYQVGLIAVTDVQEARAAHDSGAAAVIASKRQLASAQESLREITGEGFDTLARPIEPFELSTPEPSSEDRWVQMALQQNLSLVSSRLAADIARENVSSARGGHFPTLDLVASRYRLTSDGDYLNANNTPYGTTSLDQYQNSIGIHRAERHRIRLRSGNPDRGGGARFAPPVDSGPNRLLTQPLRLHGQRGEAAASGRHSLRANSRESQSPAQRFFPGFGFGARINGSMSAVSRSTAPRCASTNSRADRTARSRAAGS